MIRQVLGEAIASARSQPVSSTITVLMVTGMILVVMLTTGRTVGAEQQVLRSIDSAGTRSILISAEDAAGLTSDVLNRIHGIEGIEWAGAFSSAMDATNAGVSEATRVPVRYAYGDELSRLGIPATSPLPGQLAYASQRALDLLGLPDAAGAITLTTGAEFAVGGRVTTPEYLRGFEPLVLVPRTEATGHERVNLVVVIAQSPESVAPVSDAVLSVLAADDPSTVTVQTSEALAQLRAVVRGELSTFARGLVLVLLGLTGTLVAILLSGLVMMRRKDFGRRRALGATRSLIVILLLIQTALLAVIGVALGTTVAVVILLSTRDPQPGLAFISALAFLTVTTTIAAALLPALLASRREPIRELRLP